MLLVLTSAVAAPVHAASVPAATDSSVERTTQATPTTATPGNESDAEDDTSQAAVVFYDQESDWDTLVVAQVNLSEGGFVAVFEGSRNGTLLGTSAYLVPGQFETVDVDLTTQRANDTTVVAVVYRDVDGNRTFDPAVDEPYTDGGRAVSDSAYVTSGLAPTTANPTSTASETTTTTATDTPTPSDDAETTTVDSEAPGFGVLAAVVALLLGSALRWRRG